jgi:hypothetical protein
MSVALIATFGDVAATCWPVIWRVFLVCGGLVALAGTSWWAGERAWQRWQRHRRALAGLMDDGDGQGGVPGRGEHPAATRAMALGDLVISAEGERMLQARSAALTPDALTQPIAWCGFCDNLAEVGDPASCGCLGACGRAWCPRKRSAVPVTWTEREEGVR